MPRQATAAQAAPVAPGDYDGDGDLDQADFDHWGDCLTGPEAGPYAAGCEAFDFDVDGDVDLDDFAEFARVF